MSMYSNDRDDDRLAIMAISPEVLVNLGSGTFEVTASPLPDDVEIVRCAYDQMHDTFMILLRSAAFSPLLKGSVAPSVTPPMITAVSTQPQEETTEDTEAACKT